MLLHVLFNHIREVLVRKVVNAVFIPSARRIHTLQCVGDANATHVPITCAVLCKEDFADAGVQAGFLFLLPSSRIDRIITHEKSGWYISRNSNRRKSPCMLHSSRKDSLLGAVVVPTAAMDGFIMVDEIPLVPEFSVDFFLVKEMRRWHVLYVFLTGHG